MRIFKMHYETAWGIKLTHLWYILMHILGVILLFWAFYERESCSISTGLFTFDKKTCTIFKFCRLLITRRVASLCHWLHSLILRQSRSLTKGTECVARSDLDHLTIRLLVPWNNETGRDALCCAVNEMTVTPQVRPQVES